MPVRIARQYNQKAGTVHHTFYYDPAAAAHRPWIHGPWPLLPHGSRTFPADLTEDPSVQARRNAGPVVPDPGCAPELYT